MGYAQDLVNSGYHGYQGWGDNEARADFNATGGAGKGGSSGGSSGGSGGFQPLSAPDVAKLREQVYGIVSPYYEELAKQAQGDFNTALKMMKDDYSQGVRQAKEKLAITQKYGEGDLKNALAQFGLDIGNENDQTIDKLNQRGMAVYEQGPGMTPNVVTPGAFNPSYDTSAYTFNPGVSASPTENLGRGGQELSKLRQSQALRSEALLRTKMQPLEQAGLNFKQYTNAPTGFDINNPSSYQGDRSQLGTSELGAIGKYNTNSQQLRDTQQNLANQKSQQVNSLSSQFAGSGIRQIDSNLQNQLQKENQNTFVRAGV